MLSLLVWFPLLADLGGSEMKPMATDKVLESLKTEDSLPSVSSACDPSNLFGFPWVVLGGRQTICLARGGAFGDLSPSLCHPGLAGTRYLARRLVAMSWGHCIVRVSGGGDNFGHGSGERRGGMAARVRGLEDMFWILGLRIY
ncbi:unnamed protein product [Linum trigynum]|uniref:Secreted protein n=1 Tax=Linum trigynum TaxID=586398 RepID=A0AAV2FV33_9ROSI